MAKVRLYVSKGGDVKTLCDDKIENISALGAKTVERAANIEFSNSLSKWVITHKDGHIIGTADTHSKAVAVERKYLHNEFREELING